MAFAKQLDEPIELDQNVEVDNKNNRKSKKNSPRIEIGIGPGSRSERNLDDLREIKLNFDAMETNIEENQANENKIGGEPESSIERGDKRGAGHKTEPKKLIDQLINNQGITSYTIRALAILSLFNLADGGEFIVVSLLTDKLGHIWNLSHSQKGMLGSIVFVGFFLGVWISAKISDNYGRRPTFIFGAIFATVFALGSAASPNITMLLILRALFGFGVGMLSPSANSMATEVSPTKYRSWTLNLLGVFYPFGQVYAIEFARNFIETDGGWRILLAAVSIPTCLCAISSFFIYESPRFYLSSKRYNEAFSTLEKILSFKEPFTFTEEMKRRIIDEETDKEEIKANYSSLLDKKYLRLTLQLAGTFFILSFSYYGTIFILPQLLKNENEKVLKGNESHNKTYNDLIISSVAEIPSVFLCAYLANVKVLGRIKSMSIGFIFSTIAALLCSIYLDHLNIFSSIYKFMLDIPYNIIYVYSLEAYPTRIRSISIGTLYMFNRIAGITTPLVAQFAYSIKPNLPFIIYTFLAAIGFFLTHFLPYETLGRELD